METKNTTSPSFPRRRESHRDGTKFGWFTLVELIVVITILVILGTIAFLNLGNFSSWARDSGRISDIANISKGLDLVYVKNGVLLDPELGTNGGVINLYASWVLIGRQWAIGPAILSTIKMGWDGKDPVDKKSYTYLVNADKTKYQVLALLEDSTTTASFEPSILPSLVPDTYAGYESRYPATKGSSLGVLLGSTGATLNQPVQENYAASTFTGIEIFTATGGLYNAVLSSKSILSGTGNALLPMVASLDTGAGYYPGCDTPNIRLPNGQIWAACNVWATKAYTSQVAAGMTIPNCNGSTTDCASSLRSTLGSYFQWGRNEDVTSLNTGSTLAATGTLASAKLGQFIVTGGGDWIVSSNDNLWGGSWTTSTAGTFLTQWSPSAMQGPCASGYHVPTAYEWLLAGSSINNSITNASQSDTSVRVTLKLPLAMVRYGTDGVYKRQGSPGMYWTSTPSAWSANAYDAWLNDSLLRLWAADGRIYGYTIRCLKN